MAVDDRFKTLLDHISLSIRENVAFELHRQTVSEALKIDFPRIEVKKIGSFSRGSCVSGISDIDLLAVMPVKEQRWGANDKDSRTVLNKVRAVLQARYPATEIGRDGQAVVVQFAGGRERADVVPAVFSSFADSHPIYEIPDGTGRWMRTSPSAHNRYILDADERAGGKLKYVMMLLKYWRECRGAPLASFHCELLLAQERVCVGVLSYAECMVRALDLLARRECRALQDPLAISGYVRAASTEPQRERAAVSVAQGARHAFAALEAEAERNSPEAYRQWNIVFNDGFPKS